MEDITKIPWTGTEQLVISLDIGTTTTSVVLLHLFPEGVPTPQTVTSWPSSPNESKLPSALMYDASSELIAIGAECYTPEMKSRIINEQFNLITNFKLHLHSQSMKVETNVVLEGGAPPAPTTPPKPPSTLPDLPKNLTILSLYTDYLTYLLHFTHSWYLSSSPIEGSSIWDRLWPKARIIMATPDGWDERQQKVLVRALSGAGIDAGTEMGRVEFVRESEAAVCAVLKEQNVREVLRRGSIFTLADCGGSTIDTGMYEITADAPQFAMREVKTTDSVEAGGIFVDLQARDLFHRKLSGTRFDTPQTIDLLVNIFESKTKRLFTGTEASLILKFGDESDTDNKAGVRKGRMVLTRDEVMGCFEFAINEVLGSVQGQRSFGNLSSSHVILTGGFGDSPYLRRRLAELLQPLDVILITNESSNQTKPVAEGLALYALNNTLTHRAARVTYGIPISVTYSSTNSSHTGRHISRWADGVRTVDGKWSTIVAKGGLLETGKTWDQWCQTLVYGSEGVKEFAVAMYTFEGVGEPGEWAEDGHGNLLPGFTLHFSLVANLAPLVDDLPATGHDSHNNRAYWKLNFHIKAFIGGTSLKARLEWTDSRGVKREGPAKVILVDSVDVEKGEKFDRIGSETGRRLPADIRVG